MTLYLHIDIYVRVQIDVRQGHYRKWLYKPALSIKRHNQKDLLPLILSLISSICHLSLREEPLLRRISQA